MIFESDQLYHIYNQGNNRQQVFFNRENQLFFLNKMHAYILPFADVLAWCLMPNHFHLMVYVREVEVSLIHGVTPRHPVNNALNSTVSSMTPSHPVNNALNTTPAKLTTFNNSIAIMLRSYTRAIHKQRGSSGALFREATKAECITKIDEGITPSFYNTSTGTYLNLHEAAKSYPKICFDYIHQNPIAANLCAQPEQWEFSSYVDYAGLREGKLINKNRASELGLIV